MGPFLSLAVASMFGCAPSEAPPVPTFGEETPAAGAAAPAALDAAPEPDPLVTDGDKYHLVLENDNVRVLSYQDQPGDQTNPHTHREFVLYAVSPFRRRLTFPDGTFKERDFAAGDAIWMPAQTHVGTNVGSTPTDVVIVEIKRAPPR